MERSLGPIDVPSAARNRLAMGVGPGRPRLGRARPAGRGVLHMRPVVAASMPKGSSMASTASCRACPREGGGRRLRGLQPAHRSRPQGRRADTARILLVPCEAPAPRNLRQQPRPRDCAASPNSMPSKQAIHAWKPARGSSLVHHSDRGVQYLSIKYSERLAEAGIGPSLGSVGDNYDNALAKTINGLYKAEVIHRRGPWRSLEAVKYATLDCVDWFNNRRLLGSIGDIRPAEAEANHYTASENLDMAA